MSDVYIHSSANVSKDAKIGNGTKIWINVQIREGAEIGVECIISKDVYIDHSVKIGNRCKIQNGVSVYNGVEIEDDVFVGPNVTFTNDKVPRAFNKRWEITKTIIKKGAGLGANSTIICGVEIGEYAMIGSGAVVTKDVEAYALMVGNPAKKISYVCRCGNKADIPGICKECEN